MARTPFLTARPRTGGPTARAQMQPCTDATPVRNRAKPVTRGEIMKIVVIGGTGLIGSKVVEKLKKKGHAVIAAAPNTGVNTITGDGLAEALADAEVVVDVANSPSFDDKAAMDFFQTAGRNLTAAEV